MAMCVADNSAYSYLCDFVPGRIANIKLSMGTLRIDSASYVASLASYGVVVKYNSIITLLL